MSDERDAPQTDAERILELLEIIRDDTEGELRASLYTQQRGSTKYAYLDPLEIEPSEGADELFQRIRERYGAGKYKIQVNSAEGKYRGARVVTIAGDAQGSDKRGGAESDRVRELELELERARARADAGKGADMTPILVAMMENAQRAADRQMEMMIALMNREQPDKGMSSKEILSLLDRGMELGERMAAQQEPPSPIAQALAQLGPALAAAVQRSQDSQPVAQLPAADPTTTSSEEDADVFLRMIGKQLAEAFEQDADPAEIAKELERVLPADVLAPFQLDPETPGGRAKLDELQDQWPDFDDPEAIEWLAEIMAQLFARKVFRSNSKATA